MKSNNILAIIIFALIGALIGIFTVFGELNFIQLLLFNLIPISLIVFNFSVRKLLSFKSYFISRYNILTTKAKSEETFDLPKELLFEKVKEVIINSKFELIDTDKDKFEILATSKASFKSWGENLYIDFESKGDETVMKFCSVTVFQIYAWGKNQKNYTSLLNEIENSLII